MVQPHKVFTLRLGCLDLFRPKPWISKSVEVSDSNFEVNNISWETPTPYHFGGPH